jgi:hypothetical protein
MSRFITALDIPATLSGKNGGWASLFEWVYKQPNKLSIERRLLKNGEELTCRGS